MMGSDAIAIFRSICLGRLALARADYRRVLLVDGHGGFNGGVTDNEITRAGSWSHARLKIIEGEKAPREIIREVIAMVRAIDAHRVSSRDLHMELGRADNRHRARVPSFLPRSTMGVHENSEDGVVAAELAAAHP